MATTSYDVIAAEVHRKAIENLTNEMAITLVRTSGSPIVTEAKDFSTCLLDREPDHLGFAAYVLFHLGSSLVGTQVIESLVVPGDLRPGDGWIVNDPQGAGAMHQGDVSVIMPTFYGDEHLGWSFANMHVLDIGGVGISGYAPGAHDRYQEGLLFPPIRVIRDGAIDSEWEKFIGANVRAPGPVLNDIRSMIAANNTGARKLSEIVDEYGTERHHEYCEINKDLSERTLRERISRIPDGRYEAVDWNEFDGHDGADQLLGLGLTLEVDGSDFKFSYSGVPQIDAFVNSAKGAMWGQTMTALVTTLAYGDLPVNGGIWRPVEIDLGEEGTIVNSVPPAPVSNAHSEVGMRACKLTKAVLSQALSLSDDPILRGRLSGQAQDAFPTCALFGTNQHGGTSVMFYVDNATGAGGGAQTTNDGLDCYGVTAMTGCGMADVEVHEAADPVLFLWRNIIPNSGGPGQFRGGQAMEQAWAVRYTENLGGPLFNACAEVPPEGSGGGYPGSAGTFHIVRQAGIDEQVGRGELPAPRALGGTVDAQRSKVTHSVFARDDVFVTASGGGGGVGDPLLRLPETVAADIYAGYVTADHAQAVYGVLVDGAGAVDEQATEDRRAEIRRERIGGEPRTALQPPTAGVGVSLIVTDGSWCCGHCGEGLADTGSNWREGKAVGRETPISERYASMSMQVRERQESPQVVVREYFCPSCAATLDVNVVTEDVGVLAAPKVAQTLAT